MDIEIQNNVKKRCLTSEDIITMSIQSPHRKNYTLFFFKFNNFSFDNLGYVNLSNNGIFWLPKQFGTLPVLRFLNLSRNCLGTYDRCKWLWIEQFAIGKSLRLLDIRYNSLTKLPLFIDKLHTLQTLLISHNKLRFLLYDIGNLSNLEVLDISYNQLLFLPSTIIKLKLSYVNISRNPFLSNNFHGFVVKDNYKYRIINMDNNIHDDRYAVSSLKELSANIIREHRIKYDMTSTPRILSIYLDISNAYSCNICRKICTEQYCFKLMKTRFFNFHYLLFLIRDLLKEKRRIKSVGGTLFPAAQIVIHQCLSCCIKYPIVHLDDVLNGILT